MVKPTGYARAEGYQLGSCQDPCGFPCICTSLLDAYVLALTCGGRLEHANCNPDLNVHESRLLRLAEIYQQLAAHWTKYGDPEMELLCPNTRRRLLPLVRKGNTEVFVPLLQNCTGRCLFFTASGDLGLCPPGTRRGDIVTALFGGRVPFILRQKPKRPVDGSMTRRMEWEFIGECYVRRFMDGRLVQTLQERGTSSKIFELS